MQGEQMNWKFCACLTALGSIWLLATSNACAIDFRVAGEWLISMQYGQNGDFSDHGHQGYDYMEDNFESRSRVRIQLDATASESLSGQAYFEIGKAIWGKATGAQDGAALGADSDTIKLKRAYIDWLPPETKLCVRMGIQAFRSPFYALDGPTILTADGAGVTITYPANENVSLTAFWMRPYNDNYTAAKGQDDSGFMDNMDLGGLMLPLRFDGWAMTPWGIYGAIGPNTFRNSEGQFQNRISTPDGNQVFSGLFPLLGNNPKINNKTTHAYAHAWWTGLAGELTMLDPWRIAWEFTYGSVAWTDDEPMDRKGWMGAMLVEYRANWGIPGFYGWYASGDDDDLANGSERLPYIVNDFGVSGFSDTFAGPSLNGMERDRVIANTLIGTWGVGFRLKDMSFLPDLKHTFHASLWGGTNSSGILEKIHDRTGEWMSINTNGAPPMGRDNIYLTDKDYALEFGLLNKYRIYENLTFDLELGYVHLMMDRSDNVWGLAQTGGGGRGLRDAWNISGLLSYAF